LRYPAAQNYIGGEFVDCGSGSGSLNVFCPLDGEAISKVPLSTRQDLNNAVATANRAFLEWSSIPVKERVQVFFCYKRLLEENCDELAALIHEENGKTREEAVAEVLKSVEVTEFACSLPQVIAGEVLEVSCGVECRNQLYPVGVVCSITPFNFPNMVPNWTIPIALALGNTMILKPSEQVPLSAGRIAELLKQGGLPDGVFNVVHGDRTVVEAICDNPDIEAVSLVGSTPVAKAVYVRATSNLKRALCLGGAKNHLIVLSDANAIMTAINIAASMCGCAGQRCMAASVMVAVGDVDHIIEALCQEVRTIVPGKNLGAVISLQSKERIENYIAEAESAGARVLVDGRNSRGEGQENGYYVGPTILDNVRPEMRIVREEVFGPVLAIMRASTVDGALQMEKSSSFGNAAAVYTQDGGLAQYVAERASAGMVGVNIGVPVPREPFSFGGWNESKFGVGDITGSSSIPFWTKLKKTTTKWRPAAKVNWMS
jgi:malonate-semialdehyde dehydrogenase (acetylating)/methylmalonate-semialdehyde dehydrogenase